MAIEGCSLCSSARGLRGSVLWEDAVWAVVHKRPPCGVVGHLMLLAKRHFQGPAHFTDTEVSAEGGSGRVEPQGGVGEGSWGHVGENIDALVCGAIRGERLRHVKM